MCLPKQGFIVGSFLVIKFFYHLGAIPAKDFVIQCKEVRCIKVSMHVTTGVHVAAMK